MSMTTHFQPVLFCADSFETMYDSLHEFLVEWSLNDGRFTPADPLANKSAL